MIEQSRYEKFVQDAKNNMSEYRESLVENGTFVYVEQVEQLIRLHNNLNMNLLQYLFGEQLGQHLAEKFVGECKGELLTFLSRLTSEHRFFILHELKNNSVLFAYC